MRTFSLSLSKRLAILRKNEYFETMPDELVQRVAEQSVLREYKRGEILFWEGEPNEGLYLLLSGCAKIYRLSPQGRQYIIRLLQEGETFAEVPAFDGGPNPVNVEALEPCQVLIVPGTLLRQLLLEYPPFAEHVILNFGRILRNMVRTLSEMVFYQITHRLARLLNELPADEQGNLLVPLTQEQIAARLGTAREVVARSLKELERIGAIRLENRRIRVLNRNAFHEWMN